MIIDLNSNIKVIEQMENEKLIIGYFDGIHSGHLNLFGHDFENTSILTFVNHPTKKHNLYNNIERLCQLEKIGFKRIFVYDLSENINSIDFINKYLKIINPVQIIVGEDFKFGIDQKDYKTLSEHFSIFLIKKTINISTTKIKEFIANNQIELANSYLLWPYYRVGIVEKGQQLGRKLLTKTANIKLDPELFNLSEGVYITKTLLKGNYYKSVTFVGKSKTFPNDKDPMIETNLIDYHDGDFYSEQIKIIFYKKISEVKKYFFKFMLARKIKKFIKIASEFEWIKS